MLMRMCEDYSAAIASRSPMLKPDPAGDQLGSRFSNAL